MKTIGLIGGMSWESTIPYYRLINEAVRERLGGLHSARIILYSVDFHEIERLQETGEWETAGALLAGIAQTLESAGADFLVLCTNTLHKVAAMIESAIRIPLLHIADPSAEAIRAAGFSTIGGPIFRSGRNRISGPTSCARSTRAPSRSRSSTPA